ncbi:hypothetical protein Tco_0594524, partial [Tanacetum coccineum]
LYGGKVTIPIQQDDTEAWSKENSGSPIHSSWNVKIPGTEAQPSAITRSAEERIKVAIHL